MATGDGKSGTDQRGLEKREISEREAGKGWAKPSAVVASKPKRPEAVLVE
jgi:hypothetical protein